MTIEAMAQAKCAKDPACIEPMEVSVEDLRSLLSKDAGVTVLDVRPSAERREWWIPESLHVDAYQSLWSGNTSILDRVELPNDRPVVAVCAAGRTSLMAARALRHRGVDAYSLAGGMKAWSSAWNVAELASSDATLLQIRRTGKGCLSYMVASGRDAIVVDASLDPSVYMGLALERGWRIQHVVDTHIHADHVARSRRLAELTGAKQWLPAQDRAGYPHAALNDGDELPFGTSTLRAIATPGHTMESMSFEVAGRWLLTGDTLFPNAVGRPDLEAKGGEARARALALHASLQRLFELDPEHVIFAGHTSEPIGFDQIPVCTTLGQARSAIAVPEDAVTFAEAVLAKLPPNPPNHSRIVAINEMGATPEGDLNDLEAGANRCAIG